MILIRFTGGLGNQMFQYALGTYLAAKNHTELKIDTTLLKDKSRPHEVVTHRDFEMNIFDIPLNFATAKEIEYFNGKTYSFWAGKLYNKLRWQFRKKNLIIEKGRDFHPEILELPDNKCLVGSWQSEKYFKTIEATIRKLYSFREPLTGELLLLSEEIQNTNSVGIHVRRGDYVTSPLYSKTIGAAEPGYYYKALEVLKSMQNIERLYIFSDDIDWCKSNLNFSMQTTYVDYETANKKHAVDMHLMSLCRYFIISSSTFGWWAAWLGSFPQKTVIAPAKWYKDSELNANDIVPEGWIKV